MEIVEIFNAEQREQAIALLNEGFPHGEFDWSIIFKAKPGKFGHGLLLMIDGEPQGELLCFEKKESIGGRERRIVNVSSWYVREKYRRYLIWMVRHLTQDSETIFTACTPSRAVSKIGQTLGFRTVSEGSIASIPLLNGIRKSTEIEVQPCDTLLLDSETRTWIEDHRGERTISLMLRSGDRVTPFILVRGLELFQLPAARLLFAQDLELVEPALPEIHALLMRKYGIFGVYLPRIPEFEQVKSARPVGTGPSIIAKGDIRDREINLLYSELHYFPVTRRRFGRKVKKALKRLSPSFSGRAHHAVASSPRSTRPPDTSLSPEQLRDR
ncbi:MAG: hypothetical protein AAGA96_08970 [Verrucomicrobiota bacterium]